MKTITAINIKLPIAPAIDAKEPTTILIPSESLPAMSVSEDCIFCKKSGIAEVNFSPNALNSCVNVSLSIRLENSTAC